MAHAWYPDFQKLGTSTSLVNLFHGGAECLAGTITYWHRLDQHPVGMRSAVGAEIETDLYVEAPGISPQMVVMSLNIPRIQFYFYNQIVDVFSKELAANVYINDVHISSRDLNQIGFFRIWEEYDRPDVMVLPYINGVPLHIKIGVSCSSSVYTNNSCLSGGYDCVYGFCEGVTSVKISWPGVKSITTLAGEPITNFTVTDSLGRDWAHAIEPPLLPSDGDIDEDIE